MTVEISQSWLNWKAEMDDQKKVSADDWQRNLENPIFTERELGLIANCKAYAARSPSGLPGHNLMLIIAKFANYSRSLVKKGDDGKWHYYVPRYAKSGIAMTEADAHACVRMMLEGGDGRDSKDVK